MSQYLKRVAKLIAKLFPKLLLNLLIRYPKNKTIKHIVRPSTEILEQYLQKKKIKKYQNTLIIMRTDAIGDYILFRNFLADVRKSEKFKDYRIVLFGNALWKDIAEHYDNEFIDEFIWFKHSDISAEYREVEILKIGYLLFLSKAAVLVNSVISRENIFERIASLSGAKEKVAPEDDYINKQAPMAGYEYDINIEIPNYHNFEFLRNQTFFKKLLEKEYITEKLCLNPISVPLLDNKLPAQYVLLFPGAGATYRRWDAKNYASIAKHISGKHKLDIVLAGGKNEVELSSIIQLQMRNTCINLVGETTLVELVEIIRRARLLISNETSAVHIGVATNTKIICLSNGNHFGRFNPYPKEIYQEAYYIYPDSIKHDIKLYPEQVSEKFKYSSLIDINEISPQEVIEKVDEVLEK